MPAVATDAVMTAIRLVRIMMFLQIICRSDPAAGSYCSV
jgi:hypothetical protein